MAGNLAIMGRKVGMTRIFAADGTVTPVTVISAGPCPVIQKKTPETDGYSALQIGFDEIPERKVNKPMLGHFAKAGTACFRDLCELRLDNVEAYEIGQALTVDMFTAGERVKITGRSKGKGFQGVMKRWNFSGLRASHGAEKVHRSPGSVGNATHPGKVIKNKKMPGHMGDRRVTFSNLEIVAVMPEDNLILVRGQVPGAKGSLVVVQKQEKGE